MAHATPSVRQDRIRAWSVRLKPSMERAIVRLLSVICCSVCRHRAFQPDATTCCTRPRMPGTACADIDADEGEASVLCSRHSSPTRCRACRPRRPCGHHGRACLPCAWHAVGPGLTSPVARRGRAVSCAVERGRTQSVSRRLPDPGLPRCALRHRLTYVHYRGHATLSSLSGQVGGAPVLAVYSIRPSPLARWGRDCRKFMADRPSGQDNLIICTLPTAPITVRREEEAFPRSRKSIACACRSRHAALSGLDRRRWQAMAGD